MSLFIRPVYSNNRLISIAVCSTNGPVLVDEQIKTHFPFNAGGKEIKQEFPTAEWGNIFSIIWWILPPLDHFKIVG